MDQLADEIGWVRQAASGPVTVSSDAIQVETNVVTIGGIRLDRRS